MKGAIHELPLQKLLKRLFSIGITMPESKYQLVFSTVPDRETAGKIAAAVVEEGLAACVSIIPGLTSVYSWQGKICKDDELLLMMKTTADLYKQLEAAIKRLHPYEVPEVVAIGIDKGLPEYLNWISETVKPADSNKQ